MPYQKITETHPMTGGLSMPVLSDGEFRLFQKMIFEIAGISMSDAKKALVAGRLAKRVKHYGFGTYKQYFDFVVKPHLTDETAQEYQTAINLLTTNETYFFREPKHFDFLRDKILPNVHSGQMRVWSAASSTGEEAYSLAMILAAHSKTAKWEIMGSDINTQVVSDAQRGQYPMERSKNIPRTLLQQFCLKGIGSQEGSFAIEPGLRERVRFVTANLQGDLNRLGKFDVILLRNVMIYFDTATKRHVVQNVIKQLNPGGFLMVGHSESLNGVTDALAIVNPSIYQKPA